MSGAVASTLVARKFLDLSEKWKSSLPEMTPLKLMKMTYIAHGWHLGLYGSSLIDEDVYAWQYGPVFKDLFKSTKPFGRNPVKEVAASFNEQTLGTEMSEDQQELVKAVDEGYRKYKAFQLCDMTHKPGTPWHITVELNGGEENLRRDLVIPKERIKEYYQDLAAQ